MDYETPSPASQGTSSSSDSPVRARGRGRGRSRARGRGIGRSSDRSRTGTARGRRVGGRGARGRRQGQESDRAENAATSLQARREILKTRIDEMSHEETKYILHQTAQQFPSLIFDLVKDSSGNSGGYHPRPDGNSPNWCLCGNCREMPTQPEKLCCKKHPPNCITLLPDFEVLILDEAVLALARLYRQDMFALPNEEDWKKANRHAAYRQYILWQVGRLGTGDRRVIPSCAVWKIRDRFPDDFGQYTGFKASRIA